MKMKKNQANHHLFNILMFLSVQECKNWKYDLFLCI